MWLKLFSIINKIIIVIISEKIWAIYMLVEIFTFIMQLWLFLLQVSAKSFQLAFSLEKESILLTPTVYKSNSVFLWFKWKENFSIQVSIKNSKYT
jgi:hypothetical protein